MSEKEREENLPEKRKRFFSPALMSEKDAPHSTPGSLDPLLCSTPEMSAWIWFRQMFKKNCFNTTGSECNIGCHELPRLFEELLMFLSALPQMCPCWVTKAWRHFNIWAWLAWWRICVFMLLCICVTVFVVSVHHRLSPKHGQHWYVSFQSASKRCKNVGGARFSFLAHSAASEEKNIITLRKNM